MMGSVDCLKDIATSLDLFFKGLSDCGLLSVYEVQFLERDMLDIASRMKFRTVVYEFLSNMQKSLHNNLGEDDLLLIEEPTSDEIFGEFILPDGITIVPQSTDTNENRQMASLNISPDEAIIIEESDFDEIFEEINLPERITVVSESTNVSENQPNNPSNVFESTAHVTDLNMNHFKAENTKPLNEVLRMMYSNKEKSDITEPWQISILENEEVDTKIDTITEVLTKNHLTDVGWQCDMCNKVFEKIVYLQHHCREEHNGTGCFECNLCNARLMTKLSLKRHIRSHSGIKNNTCDICRKSFKRADYLTTHYKLHEGARPYKCHVCQKEFTTKTGLQLHERVHSDQKNYICHQCSKSFTRRDKLRDHVLRHLKIKRFQCSTCDKRYAEKRDLRTHLKVHDQ